MSESVLTRWARYRVAWVVGALGAVIAGGVIEVAAVFGANVPDWYMHLAMWALMFTYALLAVRALQSRRRFAGFTHFLVFAVLAVFWFTILVQIIPETPLVVAGELKTREALPIVWASVGLLGIGLLGMMVLLLVLPRKTEPFKKAPAKQKEETEPEAEIQNSTQQEPRERK